MRHSTPLTAAGLAVLLAGQLLPQIDFSIVNVTLDAIAVSLHASETELELMVAIYGVAFAVCLAMGGRLGDNLGRRRLFCTGVTVFGLASLLCGLAGNIWILLLARLIQGIGAALIVPQILASIHIGLEGRAHSRAIGLFGAIGGIAFVAGQVLGGALVDANIAGLGWRSVFLINLPICVVILALAPRYVPETRRPHPAAIDVPGTGILAALIMALLLPLALGPGAHWSWPCLFMLALVPVLGVVLWRTEQRQQHRGRHPLLPPDLLALPSVRYGLSVGGLFFCCWSGFMFTLALTLQSGAGLSPAQSGNSFIALGVAYFVASMISTTVVARIGALATLLTGAAIQMTGLCGLILLLAQVWPEVNAVTLAAPTILIGFGQGFIVSCIFRIALSDVPASHAGAGSAMLATVQQAAFGLGTALLGAAYAQTLHLQAGYLTAMQVALLTELGLMLVVVITTVRYRYRRSAACA